MTIQQRLQASLRKERDSHGFSMISLAIGMLVFVVLAGLVFAAGTGLLGQAEETVQQNSIREFARAAGSGTLHVLADDDAARISSNALAVTTGASRDGAPSAAWLAALGVVFPGVTFDDDWDLVTGGVGGGALEDGTIQVQFIVNDSTAPPASNLRNAADNPKAAAAEPAASGTNRTAQAPSSTTAPAVAWVGNDYSALRIQSRDGDNWACALIVRTADFDYTTSTADHIDPDTSTIGTSANAGRGTGASGALTPQQALNSVLGVWYDSGDTITANSDDHHCSPVTRPGSTAFYMAALPAANGDWDLHTDAGASTAKGAAEITMRRSFE